MARAGRVEGPYTYVKTILSKRGAQWWDGRSMHNPRVVRCPEGFAMFYTGITHPLADVSSEECPDLSDPRILAARAGKRIGVALATDLQGPWERLDQPVLPTKPDTFYSFLTSNAAPCVEDDGSVLLVFKARAYDGDVHGPMTLGVARAPSVRGPYEVVSMIRLNTDVPYTLEDPFCWKTGGQYHMIAKDMSGALCGERQAGIHAVSNNGVDWTLSDPVQAYSRTVPLVQGGTLELGSLERASLVFQDGVATHLAAAAADGPGGFRHATKTWNTVISLKQDS